MKKNQKVGKLFGIKLEGLELLRKKKGISRKDMCNKLSLPYNYISDIERGRRNLTYETAKKISVFFDEANNLEVEKDLHDKFFHSLNIYRYEKLPYHTVAGLLCRAGVDVDQKNIFSTREVDVAWD